MPRTKKGYIGGMEPLRFALTYERNRVIFSLQNNDGERVAMELFRSDAQFLCIAATEDEDRPRNFDAEFEIYAKLFVSTTSREASCDPNVERWEGEAIPVRIQIEEQPMRLVWSVRDPQNAVGFTCKLSCRGRSALFNALGSNASFGEPSTAYIEGDLEVVQ